MPALRESGTVLAPAMPDLQRGKSRTASKAILLKAIDQARVLIALFPDADRAYLDPSTSSG